jgi:N-acetylglucosamine-6-phosphate deacetylase
MAAAGGGDGGHRIGDLPVTVAGGRAVLTGTDTLAGSTLTQDAALRTALAAGVGPAAAVAALTAVPARVLGLGHRLGRLATGPAADVVALGADRSVTAVWAAGQRIR